MKVYIIIKTFDMSDDIICGVYANEADAINDKQQFGVNRFGVDDHVIKQFEVIE